MTKYPPIGPAFARLNRSIADQQSAFLLSLLTRAKGRDEFIYETCGWLYARTGSAATMTLSVVFGFKHIEDDGLPQVAFPVHFLFNGTAQQRREARERWMELSATPERAPPESTEEANERAKNEIKIPRKIMIRTTGGKLTMKIIADAGFHPPRGATEHYSGAVH